LSFCGSKCKCPLSACCVIEYFVVLEEPSIMEMVDIITNECFVELKVFNKEKAVSIIVNVRNLAL